MDKSHSKFGLSDKSRMIEKRKWDKAHGARTLPYQKSSSVAAFASQRVEQEFYPDDRQLSRRIDPQLLASVETLQKNSEKNLGVIEKLYQEKKEMEARIKRLEAMLADKNRPVDASSDREIEEALRQAKLTIQKEDQAASAAVHTKLTPIEAAKLFDSPKNSRSTSAPHRRRDDLNKPKRISVEEADIDKYVQKQLMLRAREKEKAIEALKYEQELRDRTLRASRGSRHSVDDMLRRQDELAIKSRTKFLERKEALDREEKLKLDEYKRKHKEHLNKQPPINGMTWKELDELNETKRRERVEKKKTEWSSMFTAGLPSDRRPSSSRRMSREMVVEEEVKPFKAEDPEKVAAKLAKQQKLWVDHLAKAKSKSTSHLETTTYSPVVVQMEKRNEMYEKKRKEKLDKKLQQEKQRAEVEKEKERIRQEKLLKVKIPDASRRVSKPIRKEPAPIKKKPIDPNVKLFKEKIMASLKNKPSLIDRHNQTLATNKANEEALMKVANAILPPRQPGLDNRRSRSAGADVLNQKERIRVSVSRKEKFDNDYDNYDNYDDFL